MTTTRLTDSSIRTGEKFDNANAGRKFNAVYYANDNTQPSNKLSVTLSNGDLVVNNLSNNLYPLITRFSKDGSTVWSKILTSDDPGNISITKDSSDNIYVSSSHTGTMWKFNSSGALQWQKKESVVGVKAITCAGSYIYATGQSATIGNTNNDLTFYIYNTSDGSRVMNNYMRHPTNLTLRGYSIGVTDNYCVSLAQGSNISGWSGVAFPLLRSTLTGGSTARFIFGSSSSDINGWGLDTDSSNVYVMGYSSNTFSVAKLTDSIGSVVWQKLYTRSPSATIEPRNMKYSNGYVYVTGRYDSGGYENHCVIKIDASTGAIVKACALSGYYTQSFYSNGIDSANVYMGAEFWNQSGIGEDYMGFLAVSQDLNKVIGTSFTLNGTTRTWVDVTSSFNTSDTSFTIQTPSYGSGTYSSTQTTPTTSFTDSGVRYGRLEY